ncbi:MAG: hypothetical protein E4H00_09890, partial [Myxococcales bacterium]
REVEAQPIRRDERTLLVLVRTDRPAEREVEQMRRRVVRLDPVAATAVDGDRDVVAHTQLVAGDVYWDDPMTPEVENKYGVMFESLETAGNFLVGELGADQTQWAWGRLHGLQLSSDLSTFGISDYDNPAPGEPLFANDGGLFTVDVANPGTADFVQTAGPSTRFVCEASPTGPSCTIQLPGGQSGDINSPYYEDLLFPYLANQPMPLVFDIDEAAANAEEEVTFE